MIDQRNAPSRARGAFGVLASVLVVCCVVPAVPASAATQGAIGISVSGGPQPVKIVPGGTVTTSFTVRNQTTHAQPISIRVTGLSAGNGAYDFDGSPTPGLTVKVRPSSFSLDPHDARDVLVSVSATRTVDPGGAYAGLIVRSQPPSKPGRTAVAAEIALPLFATVPGAASDDGQIVSFAPERPSYGSAPFAFLIGFRNTGRIHYPLSGTISLSAGTQSLGSVPFSSGAVLPGTIKTVRVEWSGTTPTGTLRALLRLKWGTSGEHSGTRTTTLVVGDGAGEQPATPGAHGGARGLVLPAIAGLLFAGAGFGWWLLWRRRRDDDRDGGDGGTPSPQPRDAQLVP